MDFEVDVAKMSLDSLRKQIKEYASQLSGLVYELAKLLQYVKTQKIYEKWGFKSFSEYVQVDLGWGKRKAEYYIKVVQLAEKAKFTESDVKKLGIAKVEKLATIATYVPDAIESLKNSAENKTVEQLSLEVSKLRGIELAKKNVTDVLNEDESMVQKSFLLYESVFDLLMATIDKVKTICNTDSVNTALQHICTVFLATEVKGTDRDLELLLKNIEKLYDVRITAYRGKDIIYGK